MKRSAPVVIAALLLLGACTDPAGGSGALGTTELEPEDIAASVAPEAEPEPEPKTEPEDASDPLLKAFSWESPYDEPGVKGSKGDETNRDKPAGGKADWRSRLRSKLGRD